MALNLKALLALRAVMTEGTITGAARQLHRTQPVVSRVIAQLEFELGFQLFRRERQRLVPTAEGLAFYGETERAIAALAEIEANARNIRDREQAPLRILAQSHIAHGLLSVALSGFCKKHPGFRFSIEIRQREYISQWVANRQFDIGFAPRPIDHPQIESELLVKAPVYVVLPRKHPLAARRQLGIADIADEPLVTVRFGIPMRTRLDAVFATHGVKPVIQGETASVVSACQLVAGGLGMTLADPFSAALFIKDQTVAIRLFKPQLLVDYLILWRDGEEHARLTEEFSAHVQMTAKALVRKVSLHAERAPL